MKHCVAIRHLAFEDLGFFGAVLRDADFTVNTIEAPLGHVAKLDALAPELVILLGAPIGANDEQDYPFLKDELALLKARIAANRPTLGICLGAQLLARAMGARVKPGPRAEIGWLKLSLTPDGFRSPLRHLAPEFGPVFHWHGDVFELPDGAVSLAATPDCEHQAFAAGKNLLGVQFHPEVTALGLESWYVGHYRALQAAPDADVKKLRKDAEEFGPILREQGEAFLRDWLNGLEF